MCAAAHVLSRKGLFFQELEYFIILWVDRLFWGLIGSGTYREGGVGVHLEFVCCYTYKFVSTLLLCIYNFGSSVEKHFIQEIR